jgi:hypothetical protein
MEKNRHATASVNSWTLEFGIPLEMQAKRENKVDVQSNIAVEFGILDS